jgi:hypothetical protein
MGSDYIHPASLPPGTRLGAWRLLEQRGQGTYGVVYRAEDVAVRTPPRVPERPWLAAVGLGCALGAGLLLGPRPAEAPPPTPLQAQEEARDGGAVAVGDAALTAPAALERAPMVWSAIAVDMPPRPLPGQSRPDANGRCPHRSHVVINGGCWMKLAVDMKDCDEKDYVFKGSCYSPYFPPARLPTSSPTNGDVSRE